MEALFFAACAATPRAGRSENVRINTLDAIGNAVRQRSREAHYPAAASLATVR
jgi:hypothetical protein